MRKLRIRHQSRRAGDPLKIEWFSYSTAQIEPRVCQRWSGNTSTTGDHPAVLAVISWRYIRLIAYISYISYTACVSGGVLADISIAPKHWMWQAATWHAVARYTVCERFAYQPPARSLSSSTAMPKPGPSGTCAVPSTICRGVVRTSAVRY